MKIELKNIKTNQALSEETICFSANLYRDGKKIGTVANRGCGGCHEYGFGYDEEKLMNDWCKANLPKWGSDLGDGKEYETDLELHISMLVEQYDNKKYMTSLLNRKIVIIDDACGVGSSYQWKMPTADMFDGTISKILEVNKDLKNPIVLNNVDTSKAYKLLMHI